MTRDPTLVELQDALDRTSEYRNRGGLNGQARNPETIRWWQRLTGFGWQIGPHRHHDKVRQVGMPRDTSSVTRPERQP